MSPGGKSFALRWELKALHNLGRAIQGAVQSYAWSYATWPISFLMYVNNVLKNPVSIVKARADNAGLILAHARGSTRLREKGQ